VLCVVYGVDHVAVRIQAQQTSLTLLTVFAVSYHLLPQAFELPECLAGRVRVYPLAHPVERDSVLPPEAVNLKLGAYLGAFRCAELAFGILEKVVDRTKRAPGCTLKVLFPGGVASPNRYPHNAPGQRF
jgi:hypothetical protein